MQRSSLYRQWRPRRFDEMVGQEHVVTTLRNAVMRDQVAHAYIFAGPRGTGKTTAARLLAKVVNCDAVDESTGEPCNDCESCRSIDGGASMSVVEMDAASHRGIDDIRELQERVPYASTSGRFRVYILDEAHMLTPEAFNALLKTLEEPPSHVIFILATTEPHKIPVTVQSRCQRFDFRYLTQDEIVARLWQVIEADESLSVTEPAVWTMARRAAGAVRDALSLLEQCRDYSAGSIDEEHVRQVTGAVSREVLFDYARSIGASDVPRALAIIDEVSMAGADAAQFIKDLLAFFRDLLMYRASDGAYNPVMPESDLDELKQVAESIRLVHLLEVVDKLAETEDRTRYSTQPRFLLEMTTIRLASVDEESVQTAAAPSREEAPEEEKPEPTSPVRPKKQRPARPASQSTDSAPPSGNEDDLQTVWGRVKEAVRRASLPTHALLQPARPGGIRDGAFILVFDDQYKFHRDRTEEQGRQVLEEAIKGVTGEALRIRCLMESEVYGAAEAGEPARDSSDQSDGAVNSIDMSEDDEPSRTDEEEPEEEPDARGGAANADSVNEIINMFSGRVVGKLSEMHIPDRDQGR